MTRHDPARVAEIRAIDAMCTDGRETHRRVLLAELDAQAAELAQARRVVVERESGPWHTIEEVRAHRTELRSLLGTRPDERTTVAARRLAASAAAMRGLLVRIRALVGFGGLRDAIDNATLGDAGAALLAENARLAARVAELEGAGRDLVATLPKCDHCAAPATRAWARGGERVCDEHRMVPSAVYEDQSVEVPEYPRAKPIRALVARLNMRGDL